MSASRPQNVQGAAEPGTAAAEDRAPSGRSAPSNQHSELRSFLKAEVLRLTGRVVELEEQLQACEEARAALNDIAAEHIGKEQRLEEQFETQKTKMTTLYAGYSAKCERWSLGTCDNVHPVVLCRICQFFTDLGYESFEVTSGGLRSWRPVPNPATSPEASEGEGIDHLEAQAARAVDSGSSPSEASDPATNSTSIPQESTRVELGASDPASERRDG